MTRYWRRETRAFEDKGQYWEVQGDWEEVFEDDLDWFNRLDPRIHTIIRIVLFFAAAYAIALVLSTAWCGDI